MRKVKNINGTYISGMTSTQGKQLYKERDCGNLLRELMELEKNIKNKSY